MRFRLEFFVGAALIGLSGASQGAPVLYLSDFIDDSTRTGFNGFESIPNDGTFYTGGSGPYVEQNISVEQINNNSQIWVTYGGTIGTNPSWYPNGGGTGYTEITLADGSDFVNFGFLASTGGGQGTVLFDLLLDGVSVLSGSTPAALTSAGGQYIGFGGGGFDTVRVRDSFGGGDSVYGSSTTLVLDSLEINGTSGSVPTPASLALLGLGLAGIGYSRRKKA